MGTAGVLVLLLGAAVLIARALDHLEEGVAVELFLDLVLELEGRELQETYCLLQLRGHREMLPQFEL